MPGMPPTHSSSASDRREVWRNNNLLRTMFTYSLLGRNKRRRGSEVNWVIAVSAFEPRERKVRAPKSRILRNAEWGWPQGKCSRKDTANPRRRVTFFSAAKVKWWGKSSPVPPATVVAWQTLSGARSNRKVFEGGSSKTFGLIAWAFRQRQA